MTPNFYANSPLLLPCSYQGINFAGILFLMLLLFYQKTSNSSLSPILSVISAISLQMLFTHISEAAGSLSLLFLYFNRHIFYRLSDILVYINDYPICLQQVEWYCNLVKQTVTILDIRLVFMTGLIIAVKKDKS